MFPVKKTLFKKNSEFLLEEWLIIPPVEMNRKEAS